MRTLLLATLVVAATCGITTTLMQRRTSTPRPATGQTEPAIAKVADESATLFAEIEHRTGDDKPGQALRTIVNALRHRTADTNGWVRLGDALVQQSRDTLDTSLYRTVERVYLHARQLDPNNTEALAGLAWAAGASHRFEDSVAWATLALKQNPDLPAAYGILGDAAV